MESVLEHLKSMADLVSQFLLTNKILCLLRYQSGCYGLKVSVSPY